MAREENIIIRRYSDRTHKQCLFCKELYEKYLPQCPHCLKNSNNIYYFNNMSQNMSEIKDNLWSILSRLGEIQDATRSIMHDTRHIIGDLIEKEETDLNLEEPTEKNFEPWITPANFSKQTEICIPGMVSIMFKRDPKLFAACGMRKGVKYYLKRDAMVDYLRQFAEGRILNNTFKYLERREEKCQEAPKITKEKIRTFPSRPRS